MRERHNVKYSKGIVQLEQIWEEEHEAGYITACPDAIPKELYFFRIGILTLCLGLDNCSHCPEGELYESGGLC